MIAGRWGHDVLYHGVHVESLFPLAGVFVAISVLDLQRPAAPHWQESESLQGEKRIGVRLTSGASRATRVLGSGSATRT